MHDAPLPEVRREPAQAFTPGTFANLKYDLPAALVVFLVATPLCLGIAMASGAPLFAGILSGIVGGMVVGLASASPLGVSGPAAGLTVIVLHAIRDLGSFPAFLLAVLLAGGMQIVLGLLRAGIIGYYFPSAVIKGMLAGIGLIIVQKQLPHAVGHQTVADQGAGTSWLHQLLAGISPGPALVAALSLLVLIVWERPFVKRIRALQYVQGPLVAVLLGMALHASFGSEGGLALAPSQLVQIPILADGQSWTSLLVGPDWAQFGNPKIWTTALTLAVVASLETLLCVEAADKLDPYGRTTPANRELLAQGLGNVVAGLLGALPVTQVIVRSSANIQSGGRTKTAAVAHGALLLVAVMAIPELLNRIPLAALAAVLLMVGYKLAKPSLFAEMFRLGWLQFAPFLVTVVGILLTDLLAGIAMGLAVAVFHLLWVNLRNPYFLAEERRDERGCTYTIHLAEEVTFLNRAAILQTLAAIPPHTRVVLDATRCVHLDYDVYEILTDFVTKAQRNDIDVTVQGTLQGHRNDSVARARQVFGNQSLDEKRPGGGS